MAGDIRNTNWSVPAPLFSVEISGVRAQLHFEVVSGLDADARPMEYRHRSSAALAPARLPGLHKTGTVTLKRGVFARDAALTAWLDGAKLNAPRPSTVTIRRLDERGNATMAWKLANAWPSKIAASDLHADGNEVAVESLE